jgi:hypothetical protein
MAARFAFAMVLGCAAMVFGAALARAEVPSGGVYITTLPTGADVWIDGTYVGRSPAFIDALASGKHSVTITKTGWLVQEVEVEIDAGKIALSSLKLEPGPRALAGKTSGSLSLRGVPAGARVELDGLPLAGDAQKPIPLSVGAHRVTIAMPRGKTTHTFNVLPEMTTQIVVQQLPADAARSSVVAPVDEYLPPGSYSLEAKKIVVRYGGHVVVARLGEKIVRFDGAPIVYDGTPETIGRKLYLPLELLEKLVSSSPNR